MSEKRQNYVVAQSARELVSWDHVSHALIRRGMLTPPSHPAWAETLKESIADLPPDELSTDALRLAWGEYSVAIAPQLEKLAAMIDGTTKRDGDGNGDGDASSLAPPPKLGLVAARSQLAFGALLENGETQTLVAASKLDREVRDGSVDQNTGWAEMRQILCRMAVVHAARLATEAEAL